MAKQYTTHTKSIGIVMPYTYVCPFCQGRVEVRRPFKVEATFTHRGIAKAGNRVAIENYLDNALQDKIQDTIRENHEKLEAFREHVSSGAYATYLDTGREPDRKNCPKHYYYPPDRSGAQEAAVKCPYCKKRQPWNMDPDAGLIRSILLFLVVFFGGMTFFSVLFPHLTLWPGGVVCLVYTLVVGTACVLLRKNIGKNQRRRIAAVPITLDMLPRFIVGEEQFERLPRFSI